LLIIINLKDDWVGLGVTIREFSQKLKLHHAKTVATDKLANNRP
jgi:hypothetical protein